jgi:hypothetical protein
LRVVFPGAPDIIRSAGAFDTRGGATFCLGFDSIPTKKFPLSPAQWACPGMLRSAFGSALRAARAKAPRCAASGAHQIGGLYGSRTGGAARPNDALALPHGRRFASPWERCTASGTLCISRLESLVPGPRDNAVFGPSLTASPRPGTLGDRSGPAWPYQAFFHRQASHPQCPSRLLFPPWRNLWPQRPAAT